MAKRIILFTGKGGVGKTTIAAATGIMAARKGYKTLIMSSDPAHSLADALDTTLSAEPKKVAENLYAQEIDLYYSMKKYWGNIRELLLLVFKWQGINEIASEELAAIPGMGEASSLLWIDKFYHSKEYDLLIIDSAPTGETLTFLSLPQVTEWWLTKAFPFQKLAFKSVGFAVRKTTGIPLDKGYEELKVLFEKLKKIHQVLCNPKVSTIRLVMNPEKMVVQETRRAHTYLQMYGYGIDAVIVNRIFPSEDIESGWSKYLVSQEKHLQEIESSFGVLPIFKIPHQRQEVFGLPLLQQIGKAIYGRRDPVQVFHQEPTYKIDKKGLNYRLRIKMNQANTNDFKVQQFGDQLVIQIKNQRQNYFLPSFLTYYQLSSYHLKNSWLTVIFEQLK